MLHLDSCSQHVRVVSCHARFMDVRPDAGSFPGSGREQPGHGTYDAVVRGVQHRRPPGRHVLRTAARTRPPEPPYRLDGEAGRLSASETTARATAAAAPPMLVIGLAVCAI
jgi:hypothetical protein